MISDMETTMVQTTIRLPKDLMDRIKIQARREHRSFNSFVEHTLDKNTELIFPKLKPEDFIISDKIKRMAGSIPAYKFTREELDADPKLAYLVEKNNL